MLASAAAIARAGRSATVVIEGESGIGKTRLADEFVRTLTDFEVVRMSATDDAAAVFPALESILLQASTTPVAVVLDNAQWLDDVALECAVQALPALRSLPSLLVVCARPGSELVRHLQPMLSGANRGSVVRLTGLSVDQTIALAAEHGVAALERSRADVLTQLTDGNPQHLALTFDELGSRVHVALPTHLPVPAAYSAELAETLDTVPERGRTLLELLAIVGGPAPASSLVQIADHAGHKISADEALDSGLVVSLNSEGQRELAIASTRVREGILRGMTHTRRRHLHRATGDCLSGPQRLEHLLNATEHTDDALADELDAEAARVGAVGRYPQAARLYSQASGVTSGRDDRERRILLAGAFAFYADDAELGGTLSPSIARCSPSFERDMVLAAIGYLLGDFPESLALVRSAREEYPDHADGRDLFMASVVASLQLAVVELPEAIATCMTALEGRAPEPVLSPIEARLRLTFGWSLWIAGRVEQADVVLAPVLALPSTRPERADALTVIGQRQYYAGQEADALHTLDRAIDSARSSNALHILPLGLALRSHVEYSLGQWDAAMLDAQAVLAHTVSSRNGNHDGLAHSVIAMLATQAGELAEAERAARVSTRLGVERPLPQHKVAAAVASAVVERAGGHPHAVIHALAPLLEGALAIGTISTGYTGWRAMQAEALIALGSLDKAASVIRTIESEPGTKAFGYTGWLRGMLAEARGDREQALVEYTRAVSEGDESATPFSHALVQRARGTVLTALGRSTEAAAALREADRLFKRLGATAYLPIGDQGAAELETLAGWTTLTPRERDTTVLAASGMLNREIGRASCRERVSRYV